MKRYLLALLLATAAFSAQAADVHGVKIEDTAQVGDDIWVSGSVGDARLALAACRNEITLEHADLQAAAARLHAPTPRVALGLALRGVAHAAIDLSDGLLGDLGHILARSQVGATIQVDAVPAGPVLANTPTKA